VSFLFAGLVIDLTPLHSVIIILDSLYQPDTHADDAEMLLHLFEYLGKAKGLKINKPKVLFPKVGCW
jgi:hypothetical protein